MTIMTAKNQPLEAATPRKMPFQKYKAFQPVALPDNPPFFNLLQK
jgi:hypothetical protein